MGAGGLRGAAGARISASSPRGSVLFLHRRPLRARVHEVVPLCAHHAQRGGHVPLGREQRIVCHVLAGGVEEAALANAAKVALAGEQPVEVVVGLGAAGKGGRKGGAQGVAGRGHSARAWALAVGRRLPKNGSDRARGCSLQPQHQAAKISAERCEADDWAGRSPVQVYNARRGPELLIGLQAGRVEEGCRPVGPGGRAALTAAVQPALRASQPHSAVSTG